MNEYRGLGNSTTPRLVRVRQELPSGDDGDRALHSHEGHVMGELQTIFSHSARDQFRRLFRNDPKQCVDCALQIEDARIRAAENNGWSTPIRCFDCQEIQDKKDAPKREHRVSVRRR